MCLAALPLFLLLPDTAAAQSTDLYHVDTVRTTTGFTLSNGIELAACR